MSAKLQVAPVAHARPFATYYYGIRSAAHDWSRIGRAVTERGAIRAAVMRIVDREYHEAIIHNEEMVVVARIMRERNKIVIINVRHA